MKLDQPVPAIALVLMSQFLIGRLGTNRRGNNLRDKKESQFLIGRLKLDSKVFKAEVDEESQFLIGRLETM